MEFLNDYINAIYGGVPKKIVEEYGDEFFDAVVTGAESVIPFNLADPLRPLLKSFAQRDKPGLATQEVKKATEQKKEQESSPDVGDFRSPDNKYFTNENYGFQSPDSYNKVLGSYPAGYVKPSTAPAMPGNKTAPISSIVSETKTPISLGDLRELQREAIAGGLREKEISFGRQQQIADQYAQISMEKSRENTARQVELENIKRWREIGIAQIEAQTRSTALTAGLMTMLQQPNANFMGALSTAFDSGAAPFAGRVRRG